MEFNTQKFFDIFSHKKLNDYIPLIITFALAIIIFSGIYIYNYVNSPYILKIDNKKIGYSEFNFYYEKALAEASKDPENKIDSHDPATINSLAESAINNIKDVKMLYKKAKESNYSISKSETDKIISQLTIPEMDDKRLLEKICTEIALGVKYFNHYLESTQITEKDARAHYEKYKDSYINPEQLKLSQIVFSKLDNKGNLFPQETLNDKLSQIQSIRTALINNPNLFENYVAKYSEDISSKKNKGDIGYVSVANFENGFEFMKSLQIGQISEILDTKNSYIIYKAYDRKPQTPIPFEEVKDRLIDALKNQQAYINLVNDKKLINNSMKVEINKAELDNFKSSK